MRVTVSGYYGFGNAGDEAILAALKQGLSALIPGVAFTVLSGDPAATAGMHGVAAISRTNPVAVIRAIRASHLVISGGGSLLQDVTGPRNIPYYLGVIHLARSLRKPVMVYAQGIGPVRGRLGKALIPRVLNGVSLITARDEESAQLLRSLGVTRPPIFVTADASLALEPASAVEPAPAGEDGPMDVPPGRGPLIGLALRSWHEGVDVPGLAALADLLASRLGARLVFLPMHRPGDREVAEAVLVRMRTPGTILDRTSHPRRLLALLSRFDLVIGMRLHALILAAIAGVPMIGLSYDPKIDNFLRSLEWEACWSVADLRADRVVTQAAGALARADELKAALARRLPILRERARHNNVLAARLALGLDLFQHEDGHPDEKLRPEAGREAKVGPQGNVPPVSHPERAAGKDAVEPR